MRCYYNNILIKIKFNKPNQRLIIKFRTTKFKNDLSHKTYLLILTLYDKNLKSHFYLSF
ncbi:hypothetical protein GCM10023338_05590 [Wohlfahrtiimonas larvae]|uniref:Uncharacterized protein n=1 Tax=Wohlfahrtiimonas larvae TaxID=1157986 RepID=A0ABP9MF98_9GAMM